ncbi:hypothetical protein VTI74DRAFT_2329 [Chaetomium olivicolor]
MYKMLTENGLFMETQGSTTFSLLATALNQLNTLIEIPLFSDNGSSSAPLHAALAPSKNVTCLCHYADAYKDIKPCIAAQCVPDKAIMMAEENVCERPHRSRKTEFLLSLVAVIPGFLMILIRLYARVAMGGRLQVDDYVMVACGWERSHSQWTSGGNSSPPSPFCPGVHDGIAQRCRSCSKLLPRPIK